MDLSQLSFAHRFDNVSGSAIREIFKVIAQPGMISFAGGNPSTYALPDEKVREISDQVLKSDGKRLLQYGATEGYPPFLESLKSYAESMLGVSVPSVLPVTGSTQAMDLLCKALIDPGDTILLEDPSFLGNIQCMRLYQANLVPLQSDENGILTDDLEEKILQYKPKLLYTIPTFQNPTGKTIFTERRKKIAELANQYGVVVAEDDPYRDLRYSGNPIPSIKSFDTYGWVVYFGSFSKIISPGLRVGFMAGDSAILRKCIIGKQSSDVHTANLNQAIVDQFIRQNLLPEHIQNICGDYSKKMSLMLQKLSEFPKEVSYTKPEGGLFLWAELPQKINALELLQATIQKKVAFVPGTHFYVNGGHANTIRLNFSNSTTEQISEGMDRINKLINHML